MTGLEMDWLTIADGLVDHPVASEPDALRFLRRVFFAGATSAYLATRQGGEAAQTVERELMAEKR